MKKNGSISVDADTLTIIANAYNLKLRKDNNTTYGKLIPRFLDFFKEYDVKATFFLIGKYAKIRENHNVIKRIIREEHEIANHTMTHPSNFSELSLRQKEREIIDMQNVIKNISGYVVKGFRAPEWDINSQDISLLEKNHYLYDSSVFPSWFRYVMKIAVLMMSGGKRMNFPASEKKFIFAPTAPYHPRRDDIALIAKKGDGRRSSIIEFPITVTPFFRLPFFGTSLLGFGYPAFRMMYPFVKLSKNPLIYELHTVELFDDKRDLCEKELFKVGHPSINTPFNRKFEIYKKVIKTFLDDYNLMTLKNLALKHPG